MAVNLTKSDNIIPRLITPVINVAMTDTPVVCLLGPRQSGKTTLVQSIYPTRPYVSMDSHNVYLAASADPERFVLGAPDIVTFDEVQNVPEILTAIKLSVDQKRIPGRFLLTGSVNLLLLPGLHDSLAGRMEIIELQPLSEAEKQGSPGKFLSNLINGKIYPRIHPEIFSSKINLIERLVTGGYPVAINRSAARARQWHGQYVRNLVEKDIPDIQRIHHSNEIKRLLEILALRTGQLLQPSNLANTLRLHRNTIDRYLSILEKLYLIRRVPAWHRNKAKRLVITPKVHMIDSGLAASLAQFTAQNWSHNPEFMGHLLESFVVQQIFSQLAWTNPDIQVWHYRDKDQVEVDVVVTLNNQTWGIEVKASSAISPRDFMGLRRLADKSGENFVQGVLLYGGSSILPVQDSRFLAVPISELWTS